MRRTHSQQQLRTRAIDSHTPARMPALMLKRSSRVMPGLRGTPAGMTTMSQSLSARSIVAVSSFDSGACAVTLQDVLACERSTPTPEEQARAEVRVLRRRRSCRCQ
jgi:hypothetical protein